MSYPFNMKAVLTSLAPASERVIPVFCGHANGADAPKIFKRSGAISVPEALWLSGFSTFRTKETRKAMAVPVSLARFCR